jgi:hypothetical protein
VTVTLEKASVRLARLKRFAEKKGVLSVSDRDRMGDFVQGFDLLSVLKLSKPAQPSTLLYYALERSHVDSRDSQRKKLVVCFCGQVEQYCNVRWVLGM